MYYATRDMHESNPDNIAQNATILAFSTREEMEAYLCAPWGPDALNPGEKVEIVESDGFCDAWLKLRRIDPDFFDDDIAPFSRDQVNVAPPNQNPGGTHYWVTPWPTIYVAQVVKRDRPPWD